MFSFPQQTILSVSYGENLAHNTLNSLVYLANNKGLNYLSFYVKSQTTIISLFLSSLPTEHNKSPLFEKLKDYID